MPSDYDRPKAKAPVAPSKDLDSILREATSLARQEVRDRKQRGELDKFPYVVRTPCKEMNVKGEPCRKAAKEGGELCSYHQSIADGTPHIVGGPGKGQGRKKRESVVEIKNRLIEEYASALTEDALKVFGEAMEATLNAFNPKEAEWVGSDLPDHAARRLAADAAMKWVHGAPKQTTELNVNASPMDRESYKALMAAAKANGGEIVDAEAIDITDDPAELTTGY